ncbi:MAG TPA: FkbM family methyltransferase [Candidatus Acidoferrum sp.]|nr:FkbM family methyltransferase [Candidatus Acidoferrum sp.]
MSALNELPASLVPVPPAKGTEEFTLKLTPFDQRHYRKMIVAREATIRRVLKSVGSEFQLRTAVDAGCGVGFYTRTLEECGLVARGFDGREENVVEARRRYPQLSFERINVEDREVLTLGEFDFVLCCGLLYHLENPLLALRHLRSLTGKCLLLESMCVPDSESSMLLREEPRCDDQSLTDIAWYPSEASIAKMLYRVGFAAVYRVIPLPNHEDFQETAERARKRTVLLASFRPIDGAGFRLIPEPQESRDPWGKVVNQRKGIVHRVGRFLASPMRKKYLTLALRARRTAPRMPIPLRLPFGAWWLADNGALDHELMYNGFEEREMRFVEHLLKPGMTVLDIGAHHGLYTLLSSKRVGRRGRVLAFEPSPREYQRLLRHVHINRRKNVSAECCALGNDNAVADLFQVDGFRDWGNSLRQPLVPEPTHRVQVPMRRLDDVLENLGIVKVDFIKLDAEGAEVEVLRGAAKLLQRTPRPVMLVEVEDLRTQPWGYAAREILQLLEKWNYRLFGLTESGSTYPARLDQESYDDNFVAIPHEQLNGFLQAETQNDQDS